MIILELFLTRLKKMWILTTSMRAISM